MVDSTGPSKCSRAIALSALIGKVLDPVTAKRGFASADLITAWPEIVGSRFAEFTQPEKIVWPRGDENAPGVLVLRVDGPRAVFVQHETGQIAERVNSFLGFGAVGQVRLVQAPVAKRERAGITPPVSLTESQKRALSQAVTDVENDRLKHALTRLGRAIMGKATAGRRQQPP